MQKNLVRIMAILVLLLLSFYCIQHPVFEKLDLTKHEGEKRALYFTKIAEELGEDSYLVEIGFADEKAVVITNHKFEKGKVVTFYGTVINAKLVAEKYHIHNYPKTPYYLSILGLIVFLRILFDEWRFDWNSLSMEGK
jgi:hypothetical protein